MASAPPSRIKRAFLTIFKISAYLLVVGLVALGVAVSVAVSQLPSYQELIRRDDLGQMIRVRAADGSVIHSMGPSFGEWLTYRGDPADHARRDGRGRGSALSLASRGRSDRHRPRDDGARLRGPVAAGRLDHHPAARPQHLPDQRPQLRPQGPRGHIGAGAGVALLQGPDPRALSQPGLFRRRRLRHRRRLAPVLRSQRHRAQRRRGRDHRRPGQGAVQLFADRRRRGRAQPRRGRPRPDGREPARSRRPRRRRPIRATSSSSATTASRTAAATSPTGCCPSSTC